MGKYQGTRNTKDWLKRETSTEIQQFKPVLLNKDRSHCKPND